MPPTRSYDKENSPPAKRTKKTLLSASSSRARNAPSTSLSASSSQLPEAPSASHDASSEPRTVRARPSSESTKPTKSTKSTAAKPPNAFTVFTDDTGTTERVKDDEDYTTSTINERVVFDIVDRCSLTDHDLFGEMSADEIRNLVERLLPELKAEGKPCPTARKAYVY